MSWIPAAFGLGKLLADLPAGLLMDRLGPPAMVGDIGAVLGASAGGWIYEHAGTRAPFFVKALAAERRATLRTPGLLQVCLVKLILFMTDAGVVAILLPLAVAARGYSPQSIGVVIALVAAAQIAALALGSRLADRRGKIAVLVPGLLVYAGGLFTWSTAPTARLFALAALMMGTGSGIARAAPAAHRCRRPACFRNS